jgi:voltage-gated potassium channel
MSTVGYGDIAPMTNEGKVIAMLSIISGIALISFATSVIVTAFSEKLTQLKEERIVEQIKKSKKFLIICGYGQLTKMFLRQDEKLEHSYIVLDKNQEKVDMALANGHNAIKADASRHEVLDKLISKKCSITILCLTNNDIENIYITLGVKIIDSTVEVIARVNDDALYDKFVRAGADHILMPNSTANTMLITAIARPNIYKAVDSILTGKNIAKIDEMILYEGNKLINKRVEDIDFKSYKMLLIGIQRGQGTPFMLNPQDDVIFEKNDIIILMGRNMSHTHFANLYYGSKR